MDVVDVQKIHNAYVYGETEELDRLWNEKSPKTLIKFYPAKYDENGVNYLLKHIQKQAIWLASPSIFNDPFDCVININCQKEAERIQRKFMQNIEDEVVAEKITNSHLGKLALKIAASELKKYLPQVHNEIEKKYT